MNTTKKIEGIEERGDNIRLAEINWILAMLKSHREALLNIRDFDATGTPEGDIAKAELEKEIP